MTFDEIKIGDTAFLKKAFTENDVKAFANISLDRNPIHIDEKYAKETIFKKRIVHGFLTGSLISAVFGTILPGPGAIYIHQTINFLKPVFIGEEVEAVVKVKDKKEEKNIIIFNTTCYNSKGDIVLDGEAVILFNK